MEPSVILQMLADHETPRYPLVNSLGFFKFPSVLVEEFDANVRRHTNEIPHLEYIDDESMYLVHTTIHWSLQIFNNYRNIILIKPNDGGPDYTKAYFDKNVAIFDEMGTTTASMKKYILSPGSSLSDIEEAAYMWVTVAYYASSLAMDS